MLTRDYDLDYCLLVLFIDISSSNTSGGGGGAARFLGFRYTGVSLNREYGISWEPNLGPLWV